MLGYTTITYVNLENHEKLIINKPHFKYNRKIIALKKKEKVTREPLPQKKNTKKGLFYIGPIDLIMQLVL